MTIGLTDKEREAMEAIIKWNTMKRAAEELGIPLGTLNQRVLRLKMKSYKYRLWIKDFDKLILQFPPKYVG